MEDNIELGVLGITFNQIRMGAYALVLKEIDGNRRIPVVIGVAEAQSIALKLEDRKLRRPLCHDVMTTTLRAFGISVDEVLIHTFSDGIFYSSLKLSDGEKEVEIDSRTSDAIAIALRAGAPIYATRELVEKVGIEYPDGDAGMEEAVKPSRKGVDLNGLSLEQLHHLLDVVVENEEYERAAEIQKVINAKNKGDK